VGAEALDARPEEPDDPPEAWRIVLASRDWQQVLRLGRRSPLHELVRKPGSWCAWVDGDSRVDAAAVARRATSAEGPWAVVLDAMQPSPGELADLAAEHVVLLMDRRTQRLIRVPGGNSSLAELMRTSGWLDPRSCVVAAPEVAASLVTT